MHFTRYLFSLFRKNRMRFIICILGFSVALGSVFAINTYTTKLEIAMNRFFMVESNSMMVISKTSSIMQIIPYSSRVKENLSVAFEEIPGVQVSIPVIFKNYGNYSSTKWMKNVIVGIDYTHLEFYVSGTGLKAGRFPNPVAQEILVGSDIATTVGERLWILNESFTITGILQPTEQIFNQFIYCEYNTVSRLYIS